MSMRRFLVSYTDKQDVEGILFSDGMVIINDASWAPYEIEETDDLQKVLSHDGRYPVTITWIDAIQGKQE